jgi:murein L,D-transpeptidase YcbB/YkuD
MDQTAQREIMRYNILPTVSGPARGWVLGFAPLALAASLTLPAVAHAQMPVREVATALANTDMDREIRSFYAAREFRPLWLSNNVTADAAERLITVFEHADLDGLDPGDYRPRRLRAALEEAREGDPKKIARAEALLSRSFAAYVRDLRTKRRSPLEVTDPGLRLEVPRPRELLGAAAAAPSLARYIDGAGWTHPLFAQLRKALAAAPERSAEAQLLRRNLDRVRALPSGAGRHVVVDTAGGRLYMYEGGRVVDSMKVIAGRPATPTPMMASLIRYATLNPYWNVPTDLTRERLAPEVVKLGPSYLKTHGYDLLADWSPRAVTADPGLVDWNAVAAGMRNVRVRQRPGPANGMGRMKFMFPNGYDIYLHDTPDKGLFRSADRYFSAGCIRLEDASRLGRWLFGKSLRPASAEPELRVPLRDPVPIYITYLTAFPEGEHIAVRADIYGRDGADAQRLRGR